MSRSQWPFGPPLSTLCHALTHVRRRTLSLIGVLLAVLGSGAMAACGPRAHIPTRPTPRALQEFPGFRADTGQIARQARALAPVLYRQRDEWFPLSRAVAIVHPERRVIAFHLLWRDDVFAAWIPGTIPTDEEVVWVGYDSTWAPTDVWTYWHGSILHAPWNRRQVAIDVQWGKHGSLPHGILLGDLPRYQSLNSFYVVQSLLVADFWLGNLTRKGPLCFCHSFRRYRTFDSPMLITERIDAVVVAADPRPVLRALFGRTYSEKPWWPWRVDLSKVKEIS